MILAEAHKSTEPIFCGLANSLEFRRAVADLHNASADTAEREHLFAGPFKNRARQHCRSGAKVVNGGRHSDFVSSRSFKDKRNISVGLGGISGPVNSCRTAQWTFLFWHCDGISLVKTSNSW